MPIRQGSSREDISANIAELIRAGHKPDQAAAIAYKTAGKDCDLTEDECLEIARGVRSEDFIAQDQLLAFDRTLDNREMDADGRLHVKKSNISKAVVNPYQGKEIPRFEELGLEPDKVYYLLRDPKELATHVVDGVTYGAATCNRIQLLRRHIAVSADDPKKDDVVGCFGEAADFEDPYVTNSLAIWDAEAIAGVESRDQCEISMSYRYVADMTPGEHKGLRFDGVMRNIIFNHGALVEQGRAGPDVLVGDSKTGMSHMSSLSSRKALLVRGALAAYLPTRLAAGKHLAYDSVLGSVTRSSYKTEKPKIAAAIKPLLANDASMEDIHKMLDSLDDEHDGAEDEDDLDAAEDEDEEEERWEREEAEDEAGYGNMSAEDRKAWDAKWGKDRKARDSRRAKDRKARDAMNEEDRKADDRARDARRRAHDRKAKDRRARDENEEDRERDRAEDRRAMDSAIRRVRADTIAEVNAIHSAQREVRPWVGEIVVAMDSAADVYKFALETIGVDVKGKHPDSWRDILLAQAKPGSERKTPVFASDAALSVGGLFPNARRIGKA